MAGENQTRYQRGFDSYIRLVRQTAKFTGAAGKLALRSAAWSLEAPGKLRPHIERRIRAELPRSEAKIALDAIMRGRAHQDAELKEAGEAMLVRAVHAATTTRVVPEEVRDEVVKLAHDVHLDPECTRVDPFVARQVQGVLDEFEPGQ